MSRARLFVLSLTLAGAALMPSTASADSPTMKLTLPSRVSANRVVPIRWEGTTGPASEMAYGEPVFEVELYALKTPADCRADGRYPYGAAMSIGRQSIRAVGSFRGATRDLILGAVKPGTGQYRMCGYVSDGSATTTAPAMRLVLNRAFRVRRAPSPKVQRIPAVRDGLYSALAPAIVGAGGDASVTLVVKQGTVVSVKATGMPTTTCGPGDAAAGPPAGVASAESWTNTTVLAGTPSVLGSSVNVIFGSGSALRPPFVVGYDLSAGVVNDRAIDGSLGATGPDGRCHGVLGFTATRVQRAGASVAVR